jgi:hypothetical protein
MKAVMSRVADAVATQRINWEGEGELRGPLLSTTQRSELTSSPLDRGPFGYLRPKAASWIRREIAPVFRKQLIGTTPFERFIYRPLLVRVVRCLPVPTELAIAGEV